MKQRVNSQYFAGCFYSYYLSGFPYCLVNKNGLSKRVGYFLFYMLREIKSAEYSEIDSFPGFTIDSSISLKYVGSRTMIGKDVVVKRATGAHTEK